MQKARGIEPGASNGRISLLRRYIPCSIILGATITDTKPNSQIDGIEKISYKVPKKDKFGKPTGEYQSSTHEKTVYDSKKISTDAYLKRGLEAANNTARISSTGKLSREWTGIDNQDVRWHGYCDNSGKITSFSQKINKEI